MRSPTERTLKHLRQMGDVAKVVERWNQFAKKRIDVFGADIQCIQGRRLVAIQATSGANHAARVTKACANPEVLAWLRTGNSFEVWSWSKRGKQNKRKLWTPRVTQLLVDGNDEIRTA